MTIEEGYSNGSNKNNEISWPGLGRRGGPGVTELPRRPSPTSPVRSPASRTPPPLATEPARGSLVWTADRGRLSGELPARSDGVSGNYRQKGPARHLSEILLPAGMGGVRRGKELRLRLKCCEVGCAFHILEHCKLSPLSSPWRPRRTTRASNAQTPTTTRTMCSGCRYQRTRWRGTMRSASHTHVIG